MLGRSVWRHLNRLNGVKCRGFQRKYSSEPELIILNPRQAGIVKVKPPPRKVSKRRPTQPSSQRPQPASSSVNSSVRFVENDAVEADVVKAIHSQRPETQGITKTRFDQIKADLVRGFRRTQLDEYLTLQQSIPSSQFKYLNKSKMAHLIMTRVWQCSVKEETSGVENVIELSEQEFVLVLGNNGDLLRSWTKSGARVSIWPVRRQIIVNSSQQTFNWIEAMLSQFLESIVVSDVDLRGINQYINPAAFPDHLAAMQQLTSTYFTGVEDGAESLAVFSGGRDRMANMSIAKRLLLQLAAPAMARKWKPSQWWFDTNEENFSKYAFHPFDDNEALEWLDRLRNWSRWERLKTRSTTGSQTNVMLRPLEQPAFDVQLTTKPPSSTHDQLVSIAEQLASTYPAPAGDVSTTLTITLGFVLQGARNETLPNAGMLKLFCSNISGVAKVASTLPMYANDVHDDVGVTNKEEEDVPKEVIEDEEKKEDFWSQILNLDIKEQDAKSVFVKKHKELDLPSNLRLIQMKFVPDPKQENSQGLPPIEAWAELPPGMTTVGAQPLTTMPRMLAVPLEANAHVSLPHEKTDFKITLAHTYPIAPTEQMEQYFLKSCRFDRLRPRFMPPLLKVDMNGQTVRYLYHSTAYVTLADLELQKSLLQLSLAEGGKLSGRKTEASVVKHAKADEFDAKAAASESVKTALAFAELM